MSNHERWKQQVESLKTARDELRVRAHLGQAELRDAWERAETKWQRLEWELNRMRSESDAPLGEVGEGINGLLLELREGYRRIRDSLERDA